MQGLGAWAAPWGQEQGPLLSGDLLGRIPPCVMPLQRLLLPLGQILQELVKAGRASSEDVPTVVTGDFNAVLLS